MSGETLSPATARLLDFLAELGPRWGLPSVPCRVHGLLYIEAEPISEARLCALLEIDPATLGSALAWLGDYRLIDEVSPRTWRTESDPWTLMLKALEERRRRELGPALELLRACESEALSESMNGSRAPAQIAKLLALVEDLAAIDMQASRLSPESLRQVIRFGGRAARFLDSRLGKGT